MKHTVFTPLCSHSYFTHFMLLNLAFVSRPAPICFLKFSRFVVQKMSPHKLPSNLYRPSKKSKCTFWEYDKQLRARNGTALCKKLNHYFDSQKPPSISLGRNWSCHKDYASPFPSVWQILYPSSSQQNHTLVYTDTREKTAWKIT